MPRTQGTVDSQWHGRLEAREGRMRRPRPSAEAVPLRLERHWAGPYLPPKLVAHADWGVEGRKRRMAVALQEFDGTYCADVSREAPEPGRLLSELRGRVHPTDAVLAGFDFPLGLPERYASAQGVTDFLELLPRLGKGEWRHFFEVAASREELQPSRPFFPAGAVKKGEAQHAQLARALKVGSVNDLRRKCDLASPMRTAAECLFWTLGAKQVGKGAIVGWRDMLIPGLKELGPALALWPFQGTLDELLSAGRLVVAETYPAEMYGHLGIHRVSKRDPASRREACERLREWARAAGVRLSPALEDQLETGFGERADGEDDFDAVVGLLGMLNVVLGFRHPGEPADPMVRKLEGWILGQS
ncbi:MAG: DUF429 domain-containing protein [Myxococcaceae bacterium]|nr:DUF429 domain-containing protein [Myxococcaceae bacterium]MCI0673443.1 DUF429 domain-containing protein [Myxococcaceae bacterium]